MSETQYLIDTHILLWALNDDERIPKHYHEILASHAEITVSAASMWEIAIKKSLGKLVVPSTLTVLIPRAGFKILDITAQHTEAVGLLPFYHEDPFDRLLIAQAQIENYTIMTHNPAFKAYGIEVI